MTWRRHAGGEVKGHQCELDRLYREQTLVLHWPRSAPDCMADDLIAQYLRKCATENPCTEYLFDDRELFWKELR
jgi:hypothetical protein